MSLEPEVHKYTLLCVDDEPTGLQLRKVILERSGCEVIIAPAGEEGLNLFSEREVHAVVLDYYMPGMHGGKVAGEMKKRKPHVPIIMLSAYVCLPEGALEWVDAAVVKGEAPSILLNAISSLVNKHGATGG